VPGRAHGAGEIIVAPVRRVPADGLTIQGVERTLDCDLTPSQGSAAYMTEKSDQQSERKRSPYFGTLIFLMVFMTAWFVGLGCLVYQGHLISSEGLLATATITRKVMHPAGEGSYTRTTFEEDFFFTTAEGSRIEDRKTDLTADDWDRVKQGDTFTVTYVASDPQIYRIGALTRSSGPLDSLAFPAILVLWGAVMALLARALHKRPRAQRAACSRPSKTESLAVGGAAGDASGALPAKGWISGPMFFGLVLLIVGGGFLLIGAANVIGGIAEDRNFRTEGKTATAMVFTKSTEQDKHARSYPLGIRFTTDAGQPVETVIHVDYLTMTSSRENKPIEIIYLPEHPTQIRAASEHSPSTPLFLWFFCALGGVLTVGGAVSIGFSFYDAKHQSKIR